jgi:hypothetical protein
LVYYFFSRIFFEKYGSRNGLGAKLLAFRPYTPFHLPSALSLLYRLSLVFGGIGVLHGTSSHTHTHTYTHTYTHTHTHSFLSVQDLRVTVCQPDLHHSCLLVQDILDILYWIVSPSDGARVAIDAVAYKTRASSTCVDSITFRRCKHLWDRHCLQGASFFRCMLHI